MWKCENMEMGFTFSHLHIFTFSHAFYRLSVMSMRNDFTAW